MINALCSAIYIDPSGFKMLQLGQGRVNGVLHEAHPACIFPCCCSAIQSMVVELVFCYHRTFVVRGLVKTALVPIAYLMPYTPTDNLDCSLILETNSKKACSTLFLLFRLLLWASIWDYKNALVWTNKLITIFC